MNDTLTANRIDAIPVDEHRRIDGVWWFLTRPHDLCFDVYKALPCAVMFKGRSYRKMGWNDETGCVSYKESNTFATRSN